MIPRKPTISPGLTPNELNFTPNRTSIQKTIQIKSTNKSGKPIVPLVKTKGEDVFKLS